MARERTERAGDVASLNGSSGSTSMADIIVGEIHRLIRLMDTSDIEELTVELASSGLKLTLRKPAPAAGEVAILEDDWDGLDAEVSAEHDGLDGRDGREEPAESIRAPLVGIYRTSMDPDGKPLVRTGDVVREGQVVAAIEALNVLNEVEAPASGRVQEVLVADGEPVEYGQPLIAIGLR